MLLVTVGNIGKEAGFTEENTRFGHDDFGVIMDLPNEKFTLYDFVFSPVEAC